MDWDINQAKGIVLGGGAGGLLSSIHSYVFNGSFLIEPIWLAVICYTILGMGAGFMGVYYFAKTDTRLKGQCIAVSIIFGFAWAPVYRGATALVEKNNEQHIAKKIDQSINNISDISNKLKLANNENLSKLTNQLIKEASELDKLGSKANSINTVKRSQQGLVLIDDATKIVEKKNKKLANSLKKELTIYQPNDRSGFPDDLLWKK